MKDIQEWLGHASFSTTADIYSHLDYSSIVRHNSRAYEKALFLHENRAFGAHQELLSLNTYLHYIFVNGVAGFVAVREKEPKRQHYNERGHRGWYLEKDRV